MTAQPRPSAASPGQRFLFGDCAVDTATRELRVGGAPVELEPGTFDVLVYLIERHDRVVPKEELLDSIWGDRFVSESALTTRVKHARAAIGDDGRSQAAIKTVHRIGYRFVADVRGDAGDEPPAEERTAPPPERPAEPASPMFGRDDDLEALRERLAGHRLVTVTGPAGVGKTSLARWAVTGPLDPPVGCRWFCDLADARDPAAVPTVVLGALGEAQHVGIGPAESIVRVMERRDDVVVLDNCEHVADAAAELVSRLLAGCPSIRILATSRRALGVDRESVYALAPLSIEAAVDCFTARALDAGASIDSDDPALRRLCARLDGIPLALELAAARARLLTPSEMIELLTDRFRLLRDSTDEGHGVSLHAAIASSWHALPVDDQLLLARLGVFVGSFTLDDVRHVAMDGAGPIEALDALDRLVRQSLVAVASPHATTSRFRLLESVRDFALARLPDTADVRRAHVAHFAARAEEIDRACQTEDIDGALADMHEIWVNLRAAVGYAADDGDTTSMRRIARSVAEYADLYAVYEVAEWCRRAALDGDLTNEDDVPLAADALAVLARTLAHQGNHDEARTLAEHAHALHQSHTTLLSVVWCAYYTGDLDAVMDAAPRLVELSRSERGFDRGYADGFTAIVQAVRQEADTVATPVVPSDAERGALGALDALTAGLRLCAAEPRQAAALLEAVVDTSLRNDYRLLLGAAASTLTQITLPARPPHEAMQTLRRTLARYRERSMWNLIAADIVMAARLLADAGRPEDAARLVGARLASGYAVGLSEVLATLLQEELERRLGEGYQALVAQGRTWHPPVAADVAIDALAAAGTAPAGAVGGR